MVRTLDIAPVRESSPQKPSGMARVLKGSHSFTCTPTRSSAIGISHISLLLFAFPAIAGTHLPTPEGWKAELAWVAGYVVRQFTCRKAVTHPALLTGLNVAQLRWLKPTRYGYAKPCHHYTLTQGAVWQNWPKSLQLPARASKHNDRHAETCHQGWLIGCLVTAVTATGFLLRRVLSAFIIVSAT